MGQVIKTTDAARQRTLKLEPPGTERPTVGNRAGFWLARGLKPLLWKLRWWKFRNPWMPALLLGAVLIGATAGYALYDHIPSPAELIERWNAWWNPAEAPAHRSPDVIRGGTPRRS